ncbi:MAG: hypothetical protein ACPL2E_01470 [Conexivisphaera sp.]
MAVKLRFFREEIRGSPPRLYKGMRIYDVDAHPYHGPLSTTNSGVLVHLPRTPQE